MDKIAEIREALEVIKRYDLSTLDNIMMPVYNFCVNAPEWLRFLLDELEQTRKESNMLREELHKFQELAIKAANHHKAERDEARSKAEEAWKEIDSLEEQLLSSQQEIEQLREERDKLIEGLHNYMKELDRRYQKAYRNYDIDCDHHQLGMAEAYEVAERRLRDILKENGVTVE